MEEEMKCYKCREADMVLERGTVNYDFSGLPYDVVLVNIPVHRCPRCGEQADSVPRVDELHRVLGLHLIGKSQRLVGAEIRFLRKLLDWTGKQMGGVFGVDSKTVSRWENDKEPIGPVSERLLRLIVRGLEPLPEGAPSWVMHTFPTMSEKVVASGPIKLKVSGGRWKLAA
jgi:putative zinc finger/helix-turn-helix YgiT family protein